MNTGKNEAPSHYWFVSGTAYWAGIVTAAGLLTGAWFAPRWLALALLVLSAGICVTALISLSRTGGGGK